MFAHQHECLHGVKQLLKGLSVWFEPPVLRLSSVLKVVAEFALPYGRSFFRWVSPIAYLPVAASYRPSGKEGDEPSSLNCFLKWEVLLLPSISPVHPSSYTVCYRRVSGQARLYRKIFTRCFVERWLTRGVLQQLTAELLR